MDELVKVVSEQAGLPEAQAKKAAEAVVGFLKDKLPSPIASQIDNVIENPGVAKGAEDALKKGLGMFGKK